MLRRLGIRAKVLAVLAVPMLVVFGMGGYISLTAWQNLQYARASHQVIRAIEALAPLTDAFQQERTLSLTYADEAAVTDAREVTDAALDDAAAVTAEIDLDQFPDNVVADFQEAQKAYQEALPTVRTRVDDNSQRAVIKNGFQQIVNLQQASLQSLANALEDRDLAAHVTATLTLNQLVDAIINEYVTGVELKGAVASSPALARTFTNQSTQTELARGEAQVAVETLGVPDLAVGSDYPTPTLRSARQIFSQGNQAAISTNIQSETWTSETVNQLDALRAVSTGVNEAANTEAADIESAAQEQTVFTVLIALAAAILSFVLATSVGRSIVVPLRRLTSAAGEVREQLPRLVEQVAVPGEGPDIQLPQIPVRSQDEVGRLAQAFNSVNATTIQVAQEQAALRGSIAEMFVNVARRDQVLLNRQLSFIDSLERAEEDPGTLANLFRLDHLATRMRRNAESLLVLAGIDSGRRLRDAMPLSDVIRTASSEIEQYDRVELDLQVDPHMLGFNALSAAHLLAEILENATVFSEPETPVVVSTGVTGGSVVVTIADQGLGMADNEIEAANHKIASVSASDALGAQRLGLFVVGRLAQRLGAEVTLRKRAGGTGTEAVVRFPSTLFSANEVNQLAPTSPAPSAVTPAVQTPYGAVEAPEVREVDLGALTDGETQLGLPRRRRGDDTGFSPAVPEQPTRQPVGPVPTQGGAALPSRSRKTFDEDNIVLPEAQATNLSPDLGVDTGEWSPAQVVRQTATGLPSRTRSATPAWAAEPEPEEPKVAPPADPAARAGLFSGFRGRAGTQAETGTSMSVPSLVPDEEPASNGWPVPSWREPAASAPAEPEAPAPQQWEQPAEPSSQAWGPTYADAPAAEPQHTPAPSWEQPAAPAWEQQAEAPSWDQPAATPSWDQPAETPSWEQQEPAAQSWQQAPAQPAEPETDEETWAPQPVPAQSWSEQPAEQTWAPSWSEEPAAPAQDTPAPTFTAYSGYSGWAATSEQPVVSYTAPYVPFEHSLDEARSWHTGSMPVVPDPAAGAQPAHHEPVHNGYAAGPAHNGYAEPAAPAYEDQGWAPEQPAAEEPAPAEQWQAPVWQADEQPAAPAWAPEQPAAPAWAPEQPAAPQPEAAAPAWTPTPAPAAAPSWSQPAPQQAAPAWSPAPVEQPTQMFTPVEAADAVTSTTGEPPAWAPTGESSGDDSPKRGRWGQMFTRRKEDGTPYSDPTPAVTDSPAWSAPTTPEPAPAERSWGAPTWSPPAATPAPASAGSWSPPEWSGPRQPASAPQAVAPQPSVAPRIGTLDDEVAAMLALRSDIQEQALSELSQLSAYRPSALGGSAEQLTRRVPSAVPAAPPLSEEQPVERDAEQLRSRLSSFQSGTSRGRRAATNGQEGGPS